MKCTFLWQISVYRRPRRVNSTLERIWQSQLRWARSGNLYIDPVVLDEGGNCSLFLPHCRAKRGAAPSRRAQKRSKSCRVSEGNAHNAQRQRLSVCDKFANGGTRAGPSDFRGARVRASWLVRASWPKIRRSGQRHPNRCSDWI